MRPFAALFAAAVLLAACGGGGGSTPSPLPSVPRASTPKSGSARFVIAIPPGSTTASRKPAYVSSNTQSAEISVNGGKPAIVGLTASSPNCAAASSGLQCSIAVTAPIGSDTFLIALYASTDATGTPLATQSVAASITADQTTPVDVTLNGVVASLALALSNPSPVEGATADITLSVTAKDASGATIIAPGAFSSPIAIADDDTSGATNLSATQVTAPNANTLTVHYTGAHVVAHFTATAGAIAAAAVTLASVPAPTPTPSPTATPSPTPAPTSTPIAVQSSELLWVANFHGNAVLAFDTAAILGGALPAPVLNISGTNTGFMGYSPQCARTDAFGNLYVVGSEGSQLPGAITYFPSAGNGTGGNLTPSAIVAGANTLLTNPVGCTFDNAGNLWIANDDDFNYSVVMFTRAQIAGGGDVAPALTLTPVSAPVTSLCNTVSLAFDALGNLWSGSLCAPTVEFDALSITSSGSPSPVAYISQQSGANDVAFDSSGNLWTALGSEITEFNASSLQFAPDVAPNVTITGPLTQIGNAVGISFDSSGNLWVADDGSSSLLMFSKSSLASGGNIAPSAIVSGASTLLQGPEQIHFEPYGLVPTVRRR